MRWEIDADRLSLDVEVPSGTTAEVQLPDGRHHEVVAGRHTLRSERIVRDGR